MNQLGTTRMPWNSLASKAKRAMNEKAKPEKWKKSELAKVKYCRSYMKISIAADKERILYIFSFSDFFFVSEKESHCCFCFLVNFNADYRTTLQCACQSLTKSVSRAKKMVFSLSSFYSTFSLINNKLQINPTLINEYCFPLETYSWRATRSSR